MTSSSLPDWIEVTPPSPGPSERPLRPRAIYTQVIVIAVLVIALVSTVGLFAARHIVESEAVRDAATTGNLLGEVVAQPAAQDGLLTSDPAALAEMDAAVRDHVLGASIVRVKIWDRSGRIVYSDDERLIGQSFELEEEELDAIDSGKVKAEVSDLSAPENRYEKANGTLLEVYRPITLPSGDRLLFEVYFRYDEVNQRGDQLLAGFAVVTVGVIVLLIALLLPVLWRLLDRLRLARSQREVLLQKAVDASADERRRIAGTLHDGVVQELAAGAFAIAGAAERASTLDDVTLAQDLRLAAGTVRGSIGGLRSLLVDIYPPTLATAGLSAAINDLAGSLRSRGVTVQVAIDDDHGLDEAGQQLIYRLAQETLRNVAAHAEASTVDVSLARDRGVVRLEVRDDGVGFEVEAGLRHPADGHFGLRILGDLAADAGAQLFVTSAPGRGTSWRLEVPA